MRKIKQNMKVLYPYLSLLLVVTLAFSSCRKYECNPYIFPLRTKKARVVNSWNYDLVLRNGLDVTTGNVTANTGEATIDYSLSKIGFDNQDRFATWIYFNDLDTLKQYDGSWEFQDKKEKVILKFDEPFPPSGQFQEWNLIRLQERNLWWTEDTEENNHLEYRLTPTAGKSGIL